jgi:bla regulator protein BlaR1
MIAWLVDSLAASDLLMLLVLALRLPIRSLFGSGVAYVLWAMPAARLVMPPLPASWHEGVAAPVMRATGQMVALAEAVPVPGATSAPAVPHGPSLLWIAAIIWLTGAAIFLAYQWFAHLRFCKKALAGAVASQRQGRIQLVLSSTISGPLAFGILRPHVVLPGDFLERYDAAERTLALAHEINHHRRGDLVANWIALFVLALHWFNPVAWKAYRAFRTDQELANDAQVVGRASLSRRHAYACAIVKSVHGTGLTAACHLNTIRDLKRRLAMLVSPNTSRARRAGGHIAVAITGLAGLGLTASGTATAARIRDSVGDEIRMAARPLATSASIAGEPLPPALLASAAILGQSHPASSNTAAPAAVAAATIAQNEPPSMNVIAEAPSRTVRVLDSNGHWQVSHWENGRFVVDYDLASDKGQASMAEASRPPCTRESNRYEATVQLRDGTQQQLYFLCAKTDLSSTSSASTAASATPDNSASALAILRARRAKVASDVMLNDESRREALSAIDSAIADLESVPKL